MWLRSVNRAYNTEPEIPTILKQPLNAASLLLRWKDPAKRTTVTDHRGGR
jgi:hypothetical protein